MNDTGQRLRILRLKAEKTLADVSIALWNKAQLTSLLSSYERGQKTVSEDTTDKILAFLGYSRADLEALEVDPLPDPDSPLAQRKLLTLKEVQAYCGWAPSKTKGLIERGLIEWIIVGQPYYVYRESLDRFLQENKGTTVSLDMPGETRAALQH